MEIFSFGTTTYQSFYAGIVAYKVLPLESFSELQSHIFKNYFLLQSVASPILFLTLPQFGAGACFAKVALGVASGTSLLNLAVLLPWTVKLKERRHDLDKKEGKPVENQPLTPARKDLNKTFGQVHGGSMLVNLITFGSLASYGFVLSQKLLRAIPK